MRKKSHISLAGYLIRGVGLEELAAHKKAFYLGSVLPDLNPRMVKEPHEFDVTYGMLKESIRQLVEESRRGSCTERVLWRRLGVVMHYLADYFTFPHNTSFTGTLKDHCFYERDMKYRMREYVRTPEALTVFRMRRIEARRIRGLEELFSYIEQTHESYMQIEHTASDDCWWILRLCSVVLVALTEMVSENQSAGVQYRCA